ncbi:MAG: hypothetical protein Fur0018_01860 [Anaerolineales bacterium]
MNRPIRWHDYLTVNLHFTGLTVLTQTMTPLVLPLLVQHFVGEAAQGRFYGRLRLWGLMTAVLAQAAAGMFSDRLCGGIGRRRPFIAAGTLLSLFCLGLIAFSARLDGLSGYRLLFAALILMMIASNTAQGPLQALIPDLIPSQARGRFSGVKALLEVPIPLMLVAAIIGPMVGRGALDEALLLVSILLLITLGVTMFAPENPLTTPAQAMPWARLLRLSAMTILFALSILGGGALVDVGARLLHTASLPLALVVMGSIGLAAMCLPIGLGLWAALRISLGTDFHHQPAFAWWVVNRLAFLTGSTNLASFTLYFFQGRLGYTGSQAAVPASRMLLVVGVFVLLSVLPAGALADHKGEKSLLLASGLLGAVGTAVLLSVPRLEVVYIGAVLLGIAGGAFYAVNWALGTRLAPAAHAGRYLGIANLAGAGAGAVGAYVGGPIADFFAGYYPQAPAAGYVLLFGIYGALFLLSMTAILPVHTEQNE